jgi:pyruvate-formate lyase-activating enzyme
MSDIVYHKGEGGQDIPRLVWADAGGNIYDEPDWLAAGRKGNEVVPLDPAEMIPLPEGSELYLLEGRTPLGYRKAGPGWGPSLFRGGGDRDQKIVAVAAFLSPAHTQYLLPAYRRSGEAPVLPLFAYTAVAWMKGGFWVPAVRVDEDVRQEPRDFDHQAVERGIEERLAASPGNRLYGHLSRCAAEYFCPAARNLFLGRFEAPLPTSPACNAACVGCISLQPSGCCPATQERIVFTPSPEEIAQVALDHLGKVPDGVVSFGQGCEGEPLMVAEVIEEAVRLIRLQTDRGTVNLNTNGSLPDAVERLADAGLDAIRISMNSARRELYDAYFRPKGYSFDDVVRTVGLAVEKGLFTSLNYFVFPGVTDQPAEVEALGELIEKTGLQMIQWRNLNIDPDLYLESVPAPPGSLGVPAAMAAVRERFPGLRHGYFNPPLAG